MKVENLLMKQNDISADVFIDPVCWLEVRSDRIEFRTTHMMRTYYFCSEACRNAFEVNPDEYLKLKLSWYNGGWGIYLRRLITTIRGIRIEVH